MNRNQDAQSCYVIVTGATGFIGHKICEKLMNSQYSVIATARRELSSNLSEKLAKYYVPIDLATSGEADLRAFCITIEKYLLLAGGKRIMALVHCTGLAAPWGPYEEFRRAHEICTLNMFNIATQLKIPKIVYLSSSSFYMSMTDRLGIREDDVDTKSFINSYARSKWEAEVCLKQLTQRQSLIRVVALRPQIVIGPGEKIFLPRILGQAQRDGVPRVSSKGPILDFTDINNLWDAIFLAMTRSLENLWAVYNITNDDPWYFFDVLDHIGKITGIKLKTRRVPKYVLRVAAECSERLHYPLRNRGILAQPSLTRAAYSLLAVDRTLDIAAAKRDLNYRPQISMAHSLNEIFKTQNMLSRNVNI